MKQEDIVKMQIANQRKKVYAKLILNDGFFCWWCGKAAHPNDELEMHEAFIKRNALPRKLQYLIHVIENCVLLHHECHAEFGQSPEMKKQMLQMKTDRGYDIQAWVNSLPIKVKQI